MLYVSSLLTYGIKVLYLAGNQNKTKSLKKLLDILPLLSFGSPPRSLILWHKYRPDQTGLNQDKCSFIGHFPQKVPKKGAEEVQRRAEAATS